MTLHWWMHWFWVTVNFAIIFGAPATPITTTTTEKIYQNHETIKPMFVTKIPPSPPSEIKISISSTMIPFYPINNNNNNIRNAKAIYSNEPSRKKNNGNLAGPDVQKQQSSISSKPDKYRHVTTTTTRNNYQFLPTISKEFNNKNLSMGITKEEFEMQNDSPGDEKEEKDTVQIKTITKTEILWIESTTNGPIRFKNNHDNLAVLPLEFKEEEEEEEEVDVVVNKSNINNNNNNNNRDKVSFNRQTINKSESLIFVSPSSVSSPILEASIEKLNRNDNGRFSSRNFDNIIGAEDRSFNINIVNDINEDSQSVVGGRDDNNNNNNNNFTALNIAVIAASCLAIFILITTMTTFGLIMYRRKYLNPPQTLNSDKCSNPDSSGYIDDSTIRQDNSEEMYSLDNDSFLNSLEAMTIQNYWTDSVKHTKL